jgi:hypothetical protein
MRLDVGAGCDRLSEGAVKRQLPGSPLGQSLGGTSRGKGRSGGSGRQRGVSKNTAEGSRMCIWSRETEASGGRSSP